MMREDFPLALRSNLNQVQPENESRASVADRHACPTAAIRRLRKVTAAELEVRAGPEVAVAVPLPQ